jgi:hypothetical protein
MKKSPAVLALFVALSASVTAQESAESVRTSGSAELRRASEAMIAPTGRSLSIRLPETVSKGATISIQYASGGGSISDSFVVTGITVTDGACSIESKRDMASGSALSDMIHARPCSRLK